MPAPNKKSLGEAIDAVVSALTGLDEPSKLIAVKAACEHLNISLGSVQPPAGSGTPPVMPPFAPPVPPSDVVDIKTLKNTKNPRNNSEMACVVAYYLKYAAPEDEKKSEIQSGDIEKYFVQASYRLPKVLGQVLPDAKAAGYFDSVAHGKYKLNPVGHNLVVHSLPRGKNKKV